MVRASTAKVGGLGLDSQWLPKHFFSQFVSMSDLSPVAFLPPVIGVGKNHNIMLSYKANIPYFSHHSFFHLESFKTTCGSVWKPTI